MTNTYAKIDTTNTVVNIQLADDADYFDPTYAWVLVNNLYCSDSSSIQIGCTYDGTNFYAQVGS